MHKFFGKSDDLQIKRLNDNKKSIERSFVDLSCFYNSLSKMAEYPYAGKSRKKEILDVIKFNRITLQKLFDGGKNSCENKLLLVKAIIFQLEGTFENSIKFYDQAIFAAQKYKFHNEEAIACELAGEFCFESGQNDIAALYINEARNAYRKAGNTEKSANIENSYPDLVLNIGDKEKDIATISSDEASIAGSLEALDLATVIKASQTISGEILLEKLIEHLMMILIETAGAEKICLILEENGKLLLKSTRTVIGKEVKTDLSIPVTDSNMIPISLINYVKRTMNPVVLNNAVNEGMFAQDPYIIKNIVRSIVCVPLVKQKLLIGLVYMENRLSAGAFTEERLEIIKLLSTQAAISLENSLLFEKQRQIESDLQSQYEKIQAQYEEMEEMNQELEETTTELLAANESLAIFKKFTENSSQGMGMMDLEWKITYLNSALCSMIGGSSPDDLIGTHWNKYYPENIKQKIEDEIIPLLKETGEWVGELNMLSMENKVVPVIQGYFIIRDNVGKPIYLASIITDITERKRLEDHLMQAQKMEAVGRLAGGIAHDFNNYLTAIIGYCGLILNDMDSSDNHCFDIKEILKAAEKSSSLTHQLLAFSRKQLLTPKDLDINQIVMDMKKLLMRLIGENVNLVTLLMDKLDIVQADQGQIEQVIMNLVVNARDAMPEGGTITIMTGNITIGVDEAGSILNAKPGDFVCLSIEDSGIGIEENELSMIFEPFYSTKGSGKGTGLGLSVVYGIIVQHGGWINVTSKKEAGTIFNMYLPSIPTSTTVKNKDRIHSKSIAGNGERILLIEDQPEVLKFASKALRSNGYVVFEANNGRIATNCFDRENGEFDLIFSDVVLPDISGTQLIEQLLKRNPDVPVLFSSGYTDQKSQWEFIRDRSFHFIEKPYSLSDLLSIINETIKRN